MIGLVTIASTSGAVEGSASSDVWWQFLGRLHPLVVHFPIAMLVTAGTVEFFRLFRKKPEPSNLTFGCLVIGAVSAVIATWFGWLNADYESYGRSVEQTVLFHRWLGVGVAALATITLVIAILDRMTDRPLFRGLHRAGLLLCAPLVGITGHLGGELVFGAGYLTSVFETDDRGSARSDTTTDDVTDPPPDAEDSSTGIVFARDVQPILEARCYECHGPRRQKGRLRVDDMAALLIDDVDNFLVTPGDPELSELFIRVALPADDLDIMPPEGDPLTPEQIELMRRWIAEGAVVGATSETTGSTAQAADGDTDAATSLESIRPQDVDERDAAVERLLERGVLAGVIAENTGAVEVGMSLVDPTATDADLDLLAGLEDTLVWLNLARTDVTDAGIAELTRFPRIRRLHLEHTPVTDDGLAHLSGLAALEYLNLYSTAVSDAGLRSLERLTALQQLYLWETSVTDAGVERLQAALPNLRIVHREPTLVTPAEPPKSIEEEQAEADAAGDEAAGG